MKAHFFLIITVLSVLLLSSLALADPIELKLEKTNVTLKMGEQISIPIKITSTLNFTPQTITLYSEPAIHNEWLGLDKSAIELTPNKTKENATITVFASNDIGRFSFNIVAENKNAPDVRSVAKLNVLSIPPDSFLVTDFSAQKEGSEERFSIELRTVDTKTANVLVELSNDQNSVVKSINLSKEIESKDRISDSIDLSNMIAGNYTLTLKILGTNHVRTHKLEISKLDNINQTRAVTQTSFLGEDVIVYITNKGNKEETSIKIHEEAPKSAIVTLFSNGTRIADRGDNAVYEFTINKLGPGETVSLSYRIENWLIVIEIAVAVIILVILAVLFTTRASKPLIKKKHIKRGTNSFTVVVEVKAPKTRGLGEVKIRDWIPALGKVHDSHGGVKPTVREAYNGTEIIWDVGNLKSGDHRIFSYSVAASVPTMRLPKAYMDFLDGKKRSRLYSNEEIVGQ